MCLFQWSNTLQAYLRTGIFHHNPSQQTLYGPQITGLAEKRWKVELTRQTIVKALRSSTADGFSRSSWWLVPPMQLPIPRSLARKKGWSYEGRFCRDDSLSSTVYWLLCWILKQHTRRPKDCNSKKLIEPCLSFTFLRRMRSSCWDPRSWPRCWQHFIAVTGEQNIRERRRKPSSKDFM